MEVIGIHNKGFQEIKPLVSNKGFGSKKAKPAVWGVSKKGNATKKDRDYLLDKKLADDIRLDKYVVTIAQTKRTQAIYFLEDFYSNRMEFKAIIKYLVGNNKISMKRWQIEAARTYIKKLSECLVMLDQAKFSDEEKYLFMNRFKSGKIFTLQDINNMKLATGGLNQKLSTVYSILKSWAYNLKDEDM